MRRISLHIESISLRGVPGVDRAKLAEALSQELSKLLSTGAIPAALLEGGATPRLGPLRAQLPPQGPARTLGVSLAHTLYQGLGGQTSGETK